jgi:hypothetical protein
MRNGNRFSDLQTRDSDRARQPRGQARSTDAKSQEAQQESEIDVILLSGGEICGNSCQCIFFLLEVRAWRLLFTGKGTLEI